MSAAHLHVHAHVLLIDGVFAAAASGEVIEGSDLIATVPRDMAGVCVRYGAVRIVEPPLRAALRCTRPGTSASTRTPPTCGPAWLRSMIHQLFGNRAG